MNVPNEPRATTPLSASHQKTFDAIFRHPSASDIKWRDVQALLEGLAQVSEGSDGILKATRNGHSATFHPPKHGNAMAVDEVVKIRHFLEKAETPAQAPIDADGGHLLVVIDHKSARIFRVEDRASSAARLEPHDPTGYGSQLHAKNVETDGKRKPENKAFYESVARTLRDAKAILVFGSGTGESSAMRYLLEYLKEHHPDVAARVVGSLVVDENHMTEGQFLAQARAFYAQKKKGAAGA